MADYIDRQAAIAALRKFAENCKGSAEAATAAAMAISVISRVPSPWVSVKKDPPPLHTGAIVAYIGYDGKLHSDDAAWYEGNDGWEWRDETHASCEDGAIPRITHWMPFPDAPEVGTK
nr:MAG TPA: Protein of unknown function (DUF551) [Caudoviricetes sp.]